MFKAVISVVLCFALSSCTLVQGSGEKTNIEAPNRLSLRTKTLAPETIDPRVDSLRETINEIAILANQPKAKQLMVQETVALGIVDDAVQLAQLAMPIDGKKFDNESADRIERNSVHSHLETGEKTDIDNDASSGNKVTESPSLMMLKPPLPELDEGTDSKTSNEGVPTSSADRKTVKNGTSNIETQIVDKISSSIARQPILLFKALNEKKSASQIAEWIGTRDQSIRKAVKKAMLMKEKEKTQSSTDTNCSQGSFPAPVYYGDGKGSWCIIIKGNDRKHELICDAYGDDSSHKLFSERISIGWR